MTADIQCVYEVFWSEGDGQYIGICKEFPGLSWLADDLWVALIGIKNLVADAVSDIEEEKMLADIVKRRQEIDWAI